VFERPAGVTVNAANSTATALAGTVDEQLYLLTYLLTILRTKTSTGQNNEQFFGTDSAADSEVYWYGTFVEDFLRMRRRKSGVLH